MGKRLDAENSITIHHGDVVMEEGVLENSSIHISGGVVDAIGEAQTIKRSDGELSIDASSCYVLPGLIDLHIHGGAGADVTDPSPDAIGRVCDFHAAHGTTGLLMTTRTLPSEEITDCLERMRAYMERPSAHGARPLGIHLEGPYIDPQYKGAQLARDILPPSLERMQSWMSASGDHIRAVTLAPELEGAEAVIRWLHDRGVLVSAGHCGADYEQMLQAMEWGVRHMTHCFNGMRGFSHRDPGLLAAGFMDDRVSAELIMDTIHVHPGSGLFLLHNKGVDRVALITDAIRAAGMPDGEYAASGGRSLIVKEGIARLPSGELAGSTLTMNRAIAYAVRDMGLSIHEAVRMASATPAARLGIANRKGSLAPGKEADLVVMDRDFRVLLTVCEGQIIYCDSGFERANMS